MKMISDKKKKQNEALDTSSGITSSAPCNYSGGGKK